MKMKLAYFQWRLCIRNFDPILASAMNNWNMWGKADKTSPWGPGHLRTTCSRVLEKLIVGKIINNKLPAYYGTGSFTIFFTSAHLWSPFWTRINPKTFADKRYKYCFQEVEIVHRMDYTTTPSSKILQETSIMWRPIWYTSLCRLADTVQRDSKITTKLSRNHKHYFVSPWNTARRIKDNCLDNNTPAGSHALNYVTGATSALTAYGICSCEKKAYLIN
jgi:hypothetical protein